MASSTNQHPASDAPDVVQNLSPGLYVHVPFCRSRCTYCDFHVAALRLPVMRDYVEALVVEIERHAADGFVPRTIFVGGGTPSALDLESWDQLMSALSSNFSGSLLEWTVEMNPESIDSEKIELALSRGVDRISTGAQTFDETGLSLMGRRHDARQVIEAHRLMSEIGVPRTSLDLIVGWPGQDSRSIVQDLEAVSLIDPDHVSLYHLSYEQGTWLHTMLKRGAIDPLADETCIELSRQFLDGLAEQGFHRYEISNLYKRGGESLHNLNYWQRGSYLGIGSGAASFFSGQRWKNRPDVQAYINSSGAPDRVDVERPSGVSVVLEKIMLGLRLQEGINLTRIKAETDHDLIDLCGDRLRHYEQQGFLVHENDVIKITARGFEIFDAMLVELFEQLERSGDGCGIG
ncbi:MAG: radical SAM family heme chaperone HemW [Planctomycetota bacterium]|nr:radical SAM family heme chaperone HemW [Planctomycetota bacterium]